MFQTGCGVSVLGDIQNPAARCPKQPAVAQQGSCARWSAEVPLCDLDVSKQPHSRICCALVLSQWNHQGILLLSKRGPRLTLFYLYIGLRLSPFALLPWSPVQICCDSCTSFQGIMKAHIHSKPCEERKCPQSFCRNLWVPSASFWKQIKCLVWWWSCFVLSPIIDNVPFGNNFTKRCLMNFKKKF